jgi:hypothetical protein
MKSRIHTDKLQQSATWNLQSTTFNEILTWNRCVNFHFHSSCGLDPGHVMCLRRGGHGGWWGCISAVFAAARSCSSLFCGYSGGFYHDFRFHDDLVWRILRGFLCNGGKGKIRGDPRIKVFPASPRTWPRGGFLFRFRWRLWWRCW